MNDLMMKLELDSKSMHKMIQMMLLLSLIAAMAYLMISPAPKFNIYEDTVIIQKGDSYFSTSYKKEYESILGKDFSGTDTVASIEGGIIMYIEIDLKLSSGQLRIVWITPDDVMHELDEGYHQLTLSPGKHRIKVVGNQSTFEMEYALYRIDENDKRHLPK